MVRVMIGTGPKVPIGRVAIRTGASGKGPAGKTMPYKCKACGMTFKVKKELEAHVNKTHGGKNR